MAKLSIKAGATSVSVGLFIQDSSSTTGAGLTGVLFNSSGITCYAVVPGSSAAAITLGTLAAANSAWSSGGFKEVDGTNMPGVYRFDIPNTNISTGRSVVIMFKGVTNMAPLPLEIELTGWDNQDAVRGGMTALPNAAAEAAGGLYTRGSGAGQINQQANGQVDANVARWLNTAPSTPTVAGVPNVNVKTWNDLTTVALPLIPTTAGRTLDVSTTGEAGVDWANVGSPTTTLALTGTTIATTQKVDLETIKTNPVVNAGTVTFPTTATLASTTNITAGTITTTTNLTTNNDKTGYTLSNTGIDNILDRTAGVETSFTLRQALRLILSACSAKLSGAATTTVAIRDINDTKDRITATVDANGNRTAITTDVT